MLAVQEATNRELARIATEMERQREDHEERLRSIERNKVELSVFAELKADINQLKKDLDEQKAFRWKTLGIVSVFTFLGAGSTAAIVIFLAKLQ